MNDQMALAGFRELTVNEATAVNGGWSVFTIFGFAFGGLIKLVALVDFGIAMALQDWQDVYGLCEITGWCEGEE